MSTSASISRQTQARLIMPQAPTPRQMQKRLEPIVIQHTTSGKRHVYGNRKRDMIYRKRQLCLQRISVLSMILIITIAATKVFAPSPDLGLAQAVYASPSSEEPASMTTTVESAIMTAALLPIATVAPIVDTITDLVETDEPYIINLPIDREIDPTLNLPLMETLGTITQRNLPGDYYPGIDTSFQPFMCFTAVTNRNSSAYAVLNSERAYSDELGFRRSIVTEDQFSIDGEADYCVALGNYYKTKGSAGDRFLVVTSTGMYTIIVGDEQSDSDTDSLNMFNNSVRGQARMIEFIVDRRSGSGFPSEINRAGSVTAGPIEVHQGEIIAIYSISDEQYRPGFFYYDNPMPKEHQDYLWEVCQYYDVPMDVMLALIQTESTYRSHIISSTNDYGYSQINVSNHTGLRNTLSDHELRVDKSKRFDFLDPYDNILAGVYWLSRYIHRYELHQALMCYNLGEGGAGIRFNRGEYTSSYSWTVVNRISQQLPQL